MDGPIPYRVEYASTGRAGCKGSFVCKRDGIKIEKSELRFGTWVENDKIQGWQWRHWGCVTSNVLHNVKTKTDGGDMDLLDGWDELFEEDQKKVQHAVEQGHLDEADMSDQLRESEKAKQDKLEAKQAEKEAAKKTKKLEKEREKAQKKAEKEKEKEEQKAQKSKAKQEKKEAAETAKASKAKKRKRDASDSESEAEEVPPPKRERRVKQENEDATPPPTSKPKRPARESKQKSTALQSKKAVKEELLDVMPPKEVKKAKNSTHGPNQGKKRIKASTASDMDGGTDEKPPKERGKAKKETPAPTRRSTRNKG